MAIFPFMKSALGFNRSNLGKHIQVSGYLKVRVSRPWSKQEQCLTYDN